VSEKETAHEGANIAAMQADIASARADFLASLTELREQTAPAALAQRGLRAAGGKKAIKR